MKKLIIIGNTSNAKLAHYYFTKDSDYEVVAFAVHEKYIEGSTFCDLPVVPLEFIENQYTPKDYDAFVAVGYTKMNEVREQLYNEMKSKGYKLPNFISSNCSFLTDEIIGDNNLILEDNTIQPFVKIGSNNVFWSGNHIGHDVAIKDHNFITSQVVIAGFVKVGNNCFFGVNSTIRDDISIADKTLIGAGAVIMKSTNENSVWLAPSAVKLNKPSTEVDL